VGKVRRSCICWEVRGGIGENRKKGDPGSCGRIAGMRGDFTSVRGGKEWYDEYFPARET